MEPEREQLVEKLAQSLRPHTLLATVRDLLVVRGHTNIRITDGPGDGGRDIHSTAPSGRRHLVQCKYHTNPEAACSTSETGELPLAMLKLGYSHGLFVTNARVSPQGKREYLDNYPTLKLDFLEGEDLVRELFADGLLSAIWLGSGAVARNPFTASLAAIVRRHRDDASLLPFRVLPEGWALTAQLFLAERHPRCAFRISESMMSAEAFEPYRAPEPPTAEEVSYYPMWGTAFVCDGVASLDDVKSISQDVARAVALVMGRFEEGCTIRVGRPEIVPLRGDRAGSSFRPEGFSPVSIVATAFSCGDELAWFDADSTPLWSGETDARVTEGSWIRLYAADLDACLAVEIDSGLSLRERALQDSIRDLELETWAKSVFCLTAPWTSWNDESVPAPDDTALITRLGRQLSGWLHADLLGGPVPMRSTDPALPSFFVGNDPAELARLELIRSQLMRQADTELIPPAEARHLLAANGCDPLPEIRRKVFHTGEVLAYLESCPSPLLPHSRRLTLTTAWKTSDLGSLCHAIAWACYESGPFGIDWDLVENGAHAEVAVKMFQHHDLQTVPTNLLLERAHAWAHTFIDAVKRRVGEAAALMTREYWHVHHDVNLGMPFELRWNQASGEPPNG